MYTWDARIRFSETDENARLKLTSLVDYFQDCSTFQSEDVGFGVEWLLTHRRVWVVNSWQIDIMRLPHSGERVTVGTVPYDIHGFIGLRNFFMNSPSGERLAIANSVWSYLDIDTGEAIRAPEEMKDAYGLEEKLDMEYLPRKLPFSADDGTGKLEPVYVRQEHLDSNGHVNNGQYIRLAMAAAFGDGEPDVARLRAEYKKQAHLGDVLTPAVIVSPDGKKSTTALLGEDGASYCTVEVTLR